MYHTSSSSSSFTYALSILFLLFTRTFSFTPVTSLYSDEADLYDWYHPYVGDIHYSTTSSSSSSSSSPSSLYNDILYVTSQSTGSIASIHSTNGELISHTTYEYERNIKTLDIHINQKRYIAMLNAYDNKLLNNTTSSSSLPYAIRLYTPSAGRTSIKSNVRSYDTTATTDNNLELLWEYSVSTQKSHSQYHYMDSQLRQQLYVDTHSHSYGAATTHGNEKAEGGDMKYVTINSGKTYDLLVTGYSKDLNVIDIHTGNVVAQHRISGTGSITHIFVNSDNADDPSTVSVYVSIYNPITNDILVETYTLKANGNTVQLNKLPTFPLPLKVISSSLYSTLGDRYIVTTDYKQPHKSIQVYDLWHKNARKEIEWRSLAAHRAEASEAEEKVIQLISLHPTHHTFLLTTTHVYYVFYLSVNDGGEINVKLLSQHPYHASSLESSSNVVGILPFTYLYVSIKHNKVLDIEQHSVGEGSIAGTSIHRALIENLLLPVSTTGIRRVLYPTAHELNFKNKKSLSSTDSFLLITNEYTTLSVQRKHIQWLRHESLGHIKKYIIAPLPRDTGLYANVDDIDTVQSFPPVYQRIPSQLYGILHMLVSLYHTCIRALQQLIESSVVKKHQPRLSVKYEVESIQHEDVYGFSQLLFAVTQGNTIVGINTATGEVVWQDLITTHPLDQYSHVHVKQLFLGTHHTVQMLMQYSNTINKKDTYELRTYHTSDGQLLSKHTFSYTIQQMVKLPYLDETGNNILLIVDTEQYVYTYPSTPYVVKRVNYHVDRNDIHFYHTNIHDGSIVGYTLAMLDDTTDRSKDGALYRTQVIWLFTAPPGELVASIRSRSFDDVMQSSVRVTQGGDVLLHKYTDMNVLVLVTVRFHPSDTQHLLPVVKKPIEPSVSLYILNTYTGSVIEKLVYKQSSGPVHLAVSENNIVLHLYDNTLHAYLLSAIELYVPKEHEKLSLSLIMKSLVLSLWTSSAQDESHDTTNLNNQVGYALQQSYIFNRPVKSLTFTHTERGITHKELIVGLASNQLYSIPKALLDPRRPVVSSKDQMSEKDKADMLYPYTPSIDVDPKRIISTTHGIDGLKYVTAVDTRLESTSLLIAIGYDLYGVRVTPSQGFDLLNSDFNYPFLLATVGGLLIAILISKQMAKKKELKAAWK